eukprot:7569859-Lingulodinium_polyedra.AAC.1
MTPPPTVTANPEACIPLGPAASVADRELPSMAEGTFQDMVAPYNPDDAETWIPQTPSPDTMPPFNP